jgi:hypothetical protein
MNSDETSQAPIQPVKLHHTLSRRFSVVVETRSCCATQTGLKFMVLLSQPPKWWPRRFLNTFEWTNDPDDSCRQWLRRQLPPAPYIIQLSESKALLLRQTQETPELSEKPPLPPREVDIWNTSALKTSGQVPRHIIVVNLLYETFNYSICKPGSLFEMHYWKTPF